MDVQDHEFPLRWVKMRTSGESAGTGKEAVNFILKPLEFRIILSSRILCKSIKIKYKKLSFHLLFCKGVIFGPSPSGITQIEGY
jgi:hypothetical protein